MNHSPREPHRTTRFSNKSCYTATSPQKLAIDLAIGPAIQPAIQEDLPCTRET